MPTLGEYSNVYNTCITILMLDGYQVWRNQDGTQFWAEKNGWDFCADSPCSLLGLVAVFDRKRPDRFEEHWWKEPTSISYRDLPLTPPRAYQPVYERNSSKL